MPGRKEQESRMGKRQLIRLLELGLGLCASFVLAGFPRCAIVGSGL